MKKLLATLWACLAILPLWGITSLKEGYVIEYGDPKAPTHIIHYFSFLCPNCVSLFKKEFKQMKEELVDSRKIFLTYHPVPMDLLTLQAMVCLSQLNAKEKRIFLESILEEVEIGDPQFSARLMQKAMEIFGKPVEALQDKAFLTKEAAFQDAFQFLSQDDRIQAVPTVEINNQIYLSQFPDLEFIQKKIGENNEK